MAKPYKIKRYRQYGTESSYRARPHPVTIVLIVVILVALLGLGILIYRPVVDFLTGNYTPSELDHPEPDTSISEEENPPVSAAEEEESAPEVVVAGNYRAVYLPHQTALDPAALESFLAGLAGTDINAVLFEIKNAEGNVLFNTTNEQAQTWETILTPVDLKALCDALSQSGLSLIARMSAFRDPLAAKGGRENAIKYNNTETLWVDNAVERGGKPWLNPYAEGTRSYLTALALEAVDAGAGMVVFENVCFPPYSETYATFGETGGLSRGAILRDFMEEVTTALGEKNARAALSVTALAVAQQENHDTFYGGNPLQIATDVILLDVLPYQFGGAYESEELTLTEPVQNPRQAVNALLTYAKSKLKETDSDPLIIPILQGGNEPGVNDLAPYTREQVDAQISAAKAQGCEEYVLYSSTDYLLQEESASSVNP